MRLVAILLLACPAFAADIVNAYGHIPGGGFRMAIPNTQIPWKDTAIRIVGKDVENPESRIRDLWQNKNSFGDIDYNFQVPIPQDFKDRRHYVISQWGLTPLRARNIVGTVRYNFDPNGTKPELKKVDFGGSAIFDLIPEDEYVEGAFVWIAETPVKSEAVDIPEDALKIVPNGQATTITYTANGKPLTARITSPATSKTEAAALVTIESDRYIFLQWTPDRNGCQYMSTLLKLTATGMEEAASNVYGCGL